MFVYSSRTMISSGPRLAILTAILATVAPACGTSVPVRTDAGADGQQVAGGDGAADAPTDSELSETPAPDAIGTDAAGASDDGHLDAVADSASDWVDVRDAQDGMACGNLVNSSSPVAATVITSVPRNFAGGPLTDGTYALAAVEETVSSAPARFRRTFRISEGGAAFDWIIQDVGLPSDHYFAGSLSSSGGMLTMVERCGSGTLGYPYDSKAGALTLYFLFGATGGRVFHYQLVP
jgi:hypothetical protein